MIAPLTLREFKQLIIDSLRLEGLTPDSIPDDQPLFQGGLGLDSVDALELIVALEKRLGVKIRAHDMDRETLASAAAMHRFIEHRMSAGDQSE